jgi:hypothetical protein
VAISASCRAIASVLQRGRTRAAQDESRAVAVFGADGTEDIGRGRALIPRGARPRSTPGPAPCDLVLLADAGLVGEPDLYLVKADGLLLADLFQTGGEAFSKAAAASGSWA